MGHLRLSCQTFVNRSRICPLCKARLRDVDVKCQKAAPKSLTAAYIVKKSGLLRNQGFY